jgi:hypothetical protein
MLRILLNQKNRCAQLGMALVVTLGALVMLTGTANATALPIVGPPFGPCNQNGSGCLNGGNLSVQVLANSCINFFNGNNPDVCGQPGDVYTENAQLDTTIFSLGSTGSIKDLQFTNPPQPVPQFMTAPGPGGTVMFDLTGVNNSGQPACGPTPTGVISCSAGVFTLTQQDLNTSGGICPGGTGTCGHVLVGFSFSALGYYTSTATGANPYTIDFSSQFNNETIADLLARSATASGISNAVSLTANPTGSAVPEPAAFFLVGAGMLAVAGIGRIRRRTRV